MFDASNHFPLEARRWNAEEARGAIQSVVDDIVAEWARSATLPRHPLDDYGVKSDLYMGLSGIVWGMQYLADAGAIHATANVSNRLEDLLLANRKDGTDHFHPAQGSYLFGPLSLLMQQYKLRKDAATAEMIYDSVEANNSQPVRELMWGAAGTMLCASFMHRWRAEPRWKEIYLLQAERMLGEWESIDGVGHLWTQDLYGKRRKFLGPVHGFAGNVIALIEGQRLLDPERYRSIARNVMQTSVNTACADAAHANWPGVFDPSVGGPPRLLQHCHGAAGMINALGKLPTGEDDAFDRVLEKGGALVWKAGPLKKGANLCHGTAGNGYAFLKLYERTGDELWLERARAFAMASIEQYKAMKQVFHQGRYTLWTGDLGTAFFLWDCIGARAEFPTIDIF